MSIFKNEDELKEFLQKNERFAEEELIQDESITICKPYLTNFNLKHRQTRFLNIVKNTFPNYNVDNITFSEFDFIAIGKIEYPQKYDDTITEYYLGSKGNISPYTVEVKYFRKDNKYPWYDGLGQAIINLRFGLYRSDLWHFFDPEVEDIADKYIDNVYQLLLGNIINGPICYKCCKLKDKENISLEWKYSGVGVKNHFENKEISTSLLDFILGEMDIKF